MSGITRIDSPSHATPPLAADAPQTTTAQPPRSTPSRRPGHPSLEGLTRRPDAAARANDLEMGILAPPRSPARSHRSPSAALTGTVTAESVTEAIQNTASDPLPRGVNSPEGLFNHVASRLQATLGGAVGAGMTFGLFRGVGTVAEHSADPGYLSQLVMQIKSGAIGAAAAGVGNSLAVAVAAPTANVLASRTMGRDVKLTPVNPEHIVPADAPDREAQIARIRAAQSRFGVDSAVNIVSGAAAFGGLQALRSGATANAGLSPGANYAVGAATSFVAGGLTSLLTQLVQSQVSINVRHADGSVQSHHLFNDQSKEDLPKLNEALPKALNTFLGGREGGRAILHVVSQVLQRGAIVGGSTLALDAAQAAVPSLREALARRGQSSEEANRNASATMAAVGFVAVVICYFTLLGKVAKTLPDRNPPRSASGSGDDGGAGGPGASDPPTR